MPTGPSKGNCITFGDKEGAQGWTKHRLAMRKLGVKGQLYRVKQIIRAIRQSLYGILPGSSGKNQPICIRGKKKKIGQWPRHIDGEEQE